MTYSCLKNVATGRGRKRVNSDTDSVREGAPFRRAAPQPVGMVVVQFFRWAVEITGSQVLPSHGLNKKNEVRPAICAVLFSDNNKPTVG